MHTVQLGMALALAVGTVWNPSEAALEVNPAAAIEPVEDRDFAADFRFPESKTRLGQLLFFDKILSGNRNISCGTCHHPSHGTSDGVALGLGEGASGLGPKRNAGTETPILGRVPRNAQALYFVGAKAFTRLFHDGRVEEDPQGTWQSGFWSPAREQLPPGLESVLAAQAMFPVISDLEMAGHKGENPVATAAAEDILAGPGGAWDLLAQRLRRIPEYVGLFKQVYPEIAAADEINFVHVANALAAFETVAFRADKSPFDHYLKTRDRQAMSPAAGRGMDLFYGDAGCAECHSGKLQTDQAFHAIAMPQIGPGKNDGFDHGFWQETGFVGRLEDYGRYRETFRPEDKYRFRTPTLRNVALTGPWGHSGAFRTLAEAIQHHFDPVASLNAFDSQRVDLPPLERVTERTAQGSMLKYQPVNPARLEDYLQRDFWVLRSTELRAAIAATNELEPRAHDESQLNDLVAFLQALTDPTSRDQGDLVPERVPSGLPVAD